ncbi:carboxylesterase/lipase family protein [Paenibacillus rhizophilus]|uniref:Carboxylic ester hydrolase n=1 Tax=Paenibacillus rhizophilus TaxID=1850366 RepID=A0A3N9P9F0_9BACL|nr:carboxylesterase/lipase family protein [Paenibacillus rhizophilus]RQW12868.1 carboxylesterase/lipase family protein [Paenibacillus rhizophilus]
MRQAEASTIYGTVRGIRKDGVNVWRGVPFASPPVGELRFCAPLPPERWEGVRDASSFGPVSHQPPDRKGTRFPGESPVHDEDCLYLNVWAPLEADSLPVMVWIHGGTFLTGAGSQPLFDGTALALDGNVVVVSVNYRLGPFGFLHLSPLGGNYSSNAGLLDQIAALEWVRDNIGGFGGDPRRVTVFGESAGSMSIAALLAMPAARGLFTGAIMQSGASQTLKPAQGWGIVMELLAELGLGREDAGKLRTLPAETIAQAAGRMIQRLTGGSPGMFFQPVIDPLTLPEEPVRAVANGSAQGIPVLIGTNRHEGDYFFREGAPVPEIGQSLRALEQALGVPDLSELAAHYPATREGQAGILTDVFFWRSAVAFAESLLEHGPVWMYRFDWVVEAHSLLSRAVHTAEIPYVFGNLSHLRRMGLAVSPAMKTLSDRMRSAWIAFAYSGKPDTGQLTWPQYGLAERATLVFDETASVLKDPEPDKRRLLSKFTEAGI